MNKIICGFLVLMMLSSCGSKEIVPPIRTIEVKTIEVKKPAPIIPTPDILKMKSVNWEVITDKNLNEKIKPGEPYYALDNSNYKNLILNQNSTKIVMQQQQAVINSYKKYFK